MQAHFNTKLNVYNAGELGDLKNELLKLKGVVVVIGHSNTTPQLAELLSNEKELAMSEIEFSHYYKLEKTHNDLFNMYKVRRLSMKF